MAIGIVNKPNTNPPDGEYPYGNVRDISSPGAGDGTPANTLVHGDVHQFFEKLLDAAGVSPNGLFDNEYNGWQLFEAYKVAAYEAWQTPTYSNSYIADGSSPIKFRLKGKTVRLKGTTSHGTPGSVSTNQAVFTLPENCRPIETQIFACTNQDGTPSPAYVQVDTGGVVSIRGDLQTVTNTGVWMCTVVFDID